MFLSSYGPIDIHTLKGYMSPAESYLLNSQWGSLLQVFNVFPLIDIDFYGSSISLYLNELKWIGVKVDFETACKEFGCEFEDLASKNCRDNVLSLLECWRRLTDLASDNASVFVIAVGTSYTGTCNLIHVGRLHREFDESINSMKVVYVITT